MPLDRERFDRLYRAAMGGLDEVCERGLVEEDYRKRKAEYAEALAEFFHYAFGGVPADALWEAATKLQAGDWQEEGAERRRIEEEG